MKVTVGGNIAVTNSTLLLSSAGSEGAMVGLAAHGPLLVTLMV